MEGHVTILTGGQTPKQVVVIQCGNYDGSGEKAKEEDRKSASSLDEGIPEMHLRTRV